jgi:hypothetical protein
MRILGHRGRETKELSSCREDRVREIRRKRERIRSLSMEVSSGQDGIQQLLQAEAEAQQIVKVARAGTASE